MVDSFVAGSAIFAAPDYKNVRHRRDTLRTGEVTQAPFPTRRRYRLQAGVCGQACRNPHLWNVKLHACAATGKGCSSGVTDGRKRLELPHHAEGKFG
jgi:hypothetical protein